MRGDREADVARGEWLLAASVAAISAVAARAHWQRALAPLLGQPRAEAPLEAPDDLEATSPFAAAPASAPAPAPEYASALDPAPVVPPPRPIASPPVEPPPLEALVNTYGLISYRPAPPAPPRAELAFADDAAEPPRLAARRSGPLVQLVPDARVDIELLGAVVGTLAHAYPLAGSSSLDIAGASYVRKHANAEPPSPQRLAVLLWPLVEALGMEGRIDADSEGVTLLTTACPLLDTVPGEHRAAMCELVCGEHASLLRGAAAAGGATIRAPSRMGEGAPFCMRRLAMAPIE